MLGLAGRIAGGPGVAVPQRRHRTAAMVMVLFILAIAVIVVPTPPAYAATATQQRAGLCSLEEWTADITGCAARLPDVLASRAQCLLAPIPDSPDSGLGGWFASRPAASTKSGIAARYTDFAYSGYSYTTYDIGCVPTLMHPDYKFENTVANGELLLATAVIGASNAARERAWDPGLLWGWADPLVKKATQSVYTRVFTVFGTVTLVIVGIYLLWRSRQAEMSAAMTTAGWALLVMVAVTALAKWPVYSAEFADSALISSLGIVHDAVGPPAKSIPPDQCPFDDKAACVDSRPPAVRASDTAVDNMLYRNWLRGLLGSADSVTAKKYGEALYEARSLTWDEAEEARKSPQNRESIVLAKSNEWMKVAEQIKAEDPEAYQYLQGTKGMERIGAGLIALLASILYAFFDLTASLLVLLGFLIFRWAIIAAPILGTVALLRPASAGFRRLANAVVAALFNIVIFGTGAAIYLYAVSLIMGTSSLPGWLQVVLVWLCGVVGWLLLRPYRRITQLGGKDSVAALAGGRWHRRVVDDIKDTAPAGIARTNATTLTALDRTPARVEIRGDAPISTEATVQEANEIPSQRGPARQIRIRSEDGGIDELVPASAAAVYQPRRSPVTVAAESNVSATRVEARRG